MFLIQLLNKDESLYTSLMLFKSNPKVYGDSYKMSDWEYGENTTVVSTILTLSFVWTDTLILCSFDFLKTLCQCWKLIQIRVWFVINVKMCYCFDMGLDIILIVDITWDYRLNVYWIDNSI